MKLKQLVINVFLTVSLITSSYTFAFNTINNDLNYYSIGGGRALSGPPTYNTTITIDGSTSLKLGYSCGKFDLEENITQLFDNLTGQADFAINALIASATSGLVSNLILYTLRRADPNLADMFEDAMLRYEEIISIAVKSCEQAQQEIRQGKNPFYDYITFSRARKWQEEADKAEGGDKSATATSTLDKVRNKPACTPWIGGEDRLCENKGNIEVVKEIVEEGYKQLSSAGTNNGQLGSGDARISTIWPNAQDASEWVVSAFGDIKLTNVFNEVPSGRSGRGVMPDVFEEAGLIKDKVTTLITGNPSRTIISDNDHAVLSVPGLKMTPVLLESLVAIDDPAVQTEAIDRIATEFAALRGMEKINIARRLISAGMSEPNVVASGIAAEYLMNKTLPEIASEYQMMKDELELRKAISQSTAHQLVKAYAATLTTNRRGSLGTEKGKKFEDGAIQK